MDVKMSATLFVYGTLKRGYRNHTCFCSNAIDIRPAVILGRLWQLPAGYPAIEVPTDHILANGSDDPIHDALVQAQFVKVTATHWVCPTGDWDQVYGEMITFADALRDIPPIDQLESFWPDEDTCLYRRVLVRVKADPEFVPCWVYVAGLGLVRNAQRLHEGIWHGAK